MKSILSLSTMALVAAASLFSIAFSLPLHDRSKDDFNGKDTPQKLQVPIPSSTRLPAAKPEPIDSTVTRRELRQAETTTTEQVAETTPSATSSGCASGESTRPSTEPQINDNQQELRKLLFDYYYDPESSGTEEAVSFMALSDLFGTGPLSPLGDYQYSDAAITHRQAICANVADSLRTLKYHDDLCHWNYECNFDINRFPSSIINATSCTAEEGFECVQRVNLEMTFRRTFDDNNVATWTKDRKVAVVYGYTCRRS